MESEHRRPGPLSRPPRRGLRQWWSGVVSGVVLCAAVTLVSPGGPGLVSIVSPQAGEVVGLAGVDVIARVPDDPRIRPESLRVLLNGADVTHLVIKGQNGAVGRLYGLLDGENVLEVTVEAESWWFDDRPFSTRREVRFVRRWPTDLDRG